MQVNYTETHSGADSGFEAGKAEIGLWGFSMLAPQKQGTYICYYEWAQKWR